MNQNHNPDHTVMDQEFHHMRVQIQQRIRNWLEKRNISDTPEWHQKLPEIARRVEASIYKDCATKEDYAQNFQSPIENRLAGIMKGIQQHNQQLQHQQMQQQQMTQLTTTNSSASGTMIPTPGMMHEKETRIGSDFISSSSSMSSSASPKERGRFACTGGCNDELDLDLHL